MNAHPFAAVRRVDRDRCFTQISVSSVASTTAFSGTGS